MRDAKPVLTLLVLCGCGLFLLVLQWLGASTSVRQQRLTAIALIEEARLLPPATFLAQAQWLVAHRRDRLASLALLVGLSAVIGIGEGLAFRRRDALKGLRLRNWTIGVCSVALLPGLIGSALLWPSPWSLSLVAGVGAGWSTLTMFFLLHGYPHVP